MEWTVRRAQCAERVCSRLLPVALPVGEAAHRISPQVVPVLMARDTHYAVDDRVAEVPVSVPEDVGGTLPQARHISWNKPCVSIGRLGWTPLWLTGCGVPFSSNLLSLEVCSSMGAFAL